MTCTTLAKPALVAAAALCFAAAAIAESTASADKRLDPVVSTYLDLLMCANTASEYQSDPTAAEVYREAAFTLNDAASDAGWQQADFDSALFSAQKRYQQLDLPDTDTRESWQLRHFSREHCQDRLSAATSYQSGEMPIPSP